MLKEYYRFGDNGGWHSARAEMKKDSDRNPVDCDHLTYSSPADCRFICLDCLDQEDEYCLKDRNCPLWKRK